MTHGSVRRAENLPLTDQLDMLSLIGGSGATGSWRTLRNLPLAVAP